MGGSSKSSKTTSYDQRTLNQNLQGLYGLGSGVGNVTDIDTRTSNYEAEIDNSFEDNSSYEYSSEIDNSFEDNSNYEYSVEIDGDALDAAESIANRSLDVVESSLETASDSFEDAAGLAENVSMKALAEVSDIAQSATENALAFANNATRSSSDISTENVVKYLAYAGGALAFALLWKAA